MDLRLSGGNRKIQILLAAALVVVLGAGIVMVVLGLRGSEMERPSNVIHFICDQCGYHFTRTLPELPEHFMRDRTQPGSAKGIDCPKCGAKGKAYPAFKCPKCGTYYLTDWSRDPTQPSRAGANKCPHCGTDPAEFIRQRRPTK